MTKMKKIFNESINISEEPPFELFKHEGYLCCVLRNMMHGAWNGYCAVDKDHSLYGKEYSSKVVVEDINNIKFNGNYIGMLCAAVDVETQANIISLDLAIDVHGGLTYSRDNLWGIDDELFPDLWWFGFDTMHAGDGKPWDYDYGGALPPFFRDDQYRTFEYVKEQVKLLADQLKSFQP